MALREAIVANSVQQVRELCRGGADVNARLENGQTPLTLAVGVAGVPVIRALLAAFADPTEKNAAGDDALERAVKLKRKNVFDLLAPRFDATRVADGERRMPYFIKPPPPPRDDAPFANHPAALLARAVKESQAAGPRVAELVAAAQKGDAATVRRLLLDGLNPDVMDVNRANLSALVAAMFDNHVDVIAALADAGADLDTAPLGMDCPVLVAIEWGRINLLRALGECGADVTKSNRRGVTPLDFARQQRNEAAQQELLRMGADRLRGPDEALPLPPDLPPYEFVPPPVSAEAPAGQAEFFGLPTPDVISCGLLIQADVSATARALAALLKANVHHENAVGREVVGDGHRLHRLASRRHAWTAVTQLDFTNGRLTPAYAAKLAKQLRAAPFSSASATPPAAGSTRCSTKTASYRRFSNRTTAPSGSTIRVRSPPRVASGFTSICRRSLTECRPTAPFRSARGCAECALTTSTIPGSSSAAFSKTSGRFRRARGAVPARSKRAASRGCSNS
jgi:ankyrin repeat protein